jgi:arsenate reductase (thioredoxin)
MNSEPARVLFVCIENAGRSQMAEAFAKMYGSDSVEAYSAGSRPSGTVNPQAIDVMRELGYDLTTHRSKSLNEIPDMEFDAVVTMGCGDECPFVRATHHVDWNISDPKGKGAEAVREIRNVIDAQVQELIRALNVEKVQSSPRPRCARSA